MNDALPLAVTIGDAVLYQELEDEVVLLNMENQQYYGLNEVGAKMWKSLIEAGSVATAGDLLGETYEIEQAVIRADLDGLVRDLLKAGLLKAV
jgi:FAD synthase